MAAPPAPLGRLVVCPTPIGNMGDITLRTLEQLAAADVVACEDTRHTGALLRAHGIDARLVSYHEHNERARARELAARIGRGEVVALASDAGMPLISDPGFELVRACLERGLQVEVLPGASAATVALVASGLPAERWCFVGFLPRGDGELRRLFAQARDTIVAFQSARRLAATLTLLSELDGERQIAVCRELTKLHEEVRRGSARELAEHYAEHQARGEIVLVCAGAPPGAAANEQALASLRELVAAGARPRAAAAAVARLSGGKANDLYRALTAG